MNLMRIAGRVKCHRDLGSGAMWEKNYVARNDARLADKSSTIRVARESFRLTKQPRPNALPAARVFLRRVQRISLSQFVFSDESGYQGDLKQTHAWAKAGEESVSRHLNQPQSCSDKDLL